MGKSSSQKIKVGIFVVVGTIILIVSLYFIGSRQHLFTKNIQLYAVFNNVSGLELGNNVRYSGINVGTVSKIELKDIGQIAIEMTVEKKSAEFIMKNAVGSISSDGLVGSMVVNITPGEEQRDVAVVDGDTIQSYNSVSTEQMLKTLNKTNENVALLTADLLNVTDQILKGKGTLGILLNDTLMALNIQQTVKELKETTEGADLAMSKINQMISKINYDESAAAVILSDTAAANQIRTVFSNIEKSSEDINAITKSIDDYILEIKSGKGAFNHIMQDENLTKEIDSTMIYIKEAADKLNQNLEALKHNFLLRGYFKKLERRKQQEAKREE